MPYAVTLPLDAAAAAHVERMWRALADQAGDDDALRLGYAPHITLAVLPDAVRAEDIENAVLGVAGDWDALSTVFAGFGVFPGAPPVIWAAPVVTKGLLINNRVDRSFSTCNCSTHPSLCKRLINKVF